MQYLMYILNYLHYAEFHCQKIFLLVTNWSELIVVKRGVVQYFVVGLSDSNVNFSNACTAVWRTNATPLRLQSSLNTTWYRRSVFCQAATSVSKFSAWICQAEVSDYLLWCRHYYNITSGYATMVTAGVQSASLCDDFRKPGKYVIMTSLLTS